MITQLQPITTTEFPMGKTIPNSGWEMADILQQLTPKPPRQNKQTLYQFHNKNITNNSHINVFETKTSHTRLDRNGTILRAHPHPDVYQTIRILTHTNCVPIVILNY